MWFFAPPSAWQRLPLASPSRRRTRAIGVEPTNETAATSGCSSSASTATRSPMHDVEDAVGQAGLLQQLGGPERGGRILLRRLEHEAVAARDRGRPHPHGHHRREVERRDSGDDAERLPDRVDVDPGRGLLGVLALEQGRDAAAVLDDLEPARHLAERVGEHLAVLAVRISAASSRRACEQLPDAEEELGALRERGLAPGGNASLRGLDGRVHLLDASRSRRRRVWRPVAGLKTGPAASGSALDPAAADPVRDSRGARARRRSRSCRLA